MYMWEEYPFPGTFPSDGTGPLRLKSKMHHTEGSETLEGAIEHVRQTRKKITIPDANVHIRPDQVIARDCSTDGFASILLMSHEELQNGIR